MYEEEEDFYGDLHKTISISESIQVTNVPSFFADITDMIDTMPCLCDRFKLLDFNPSMDK